MNKVILLVEDNAKLSTFLKKRLIKAGYQVSIEPQGDKAVYRIIREQPDLYPSEISFRLKCGQRFKIFSKQSLQVFFMMPNICKEIFARVTKLIESRIIMIM